MKLRSVLILAALAVSSQTALAASTCKGLSQSACTTNKACAWQKAIVKGQKSPSTGNVYKVSRKAHCRTALPTKTKAKK